jgi:preprotein translocase subunit SecD
MLYISRWKMLAIIATTLLICSFAIPNFFPKEVVEKWPK